MNLITLTAIAPTNEARFRIMRAISAVKATNDGKIVVDFLRDVAEHIDQMNRTAMPPKLQWQQGAAQLLEDLFTLVQEAEPLADKLREEVLAERNTGSAGSRPNNF